MFKVLVHNDDISIEIKKKLAPMINVQLTQYNIVIMRYFTQKI